MTRRKAFLKGKIHYDTFSALTPYGSLWSFSVKFLFLGLTLKIPLMWFLMIPRFSYLSVLCLTLWPCGSWSGHGESSLKAELHASRKPNSSTLSTHLFLMAPECTPLESSFTSTNNSSGGAFSRRPPPTYIASSASHFTRIAHCIVMVCSSQ